MTMYAAIRRDASTRREWIDTTSLSALPDEAQTIANRADVQLPSWAQINPVIRVVPVAINEVR